jgi:hypothetical protein
MKSQKFDRVIRVVNGRIAANVDSESPCEVIIDADRHDEVHEIDIEESKVKVIQDDDYCVINIDGKKWFPIDGDIIFLINYIPESEEAEEEEEDVS